MILLLSLKVSVGTILSWGQQTPNEWHIYQQREPAFLKQPGRNYCLLKVVSSIESK